MLPVDRFNCTEYSGYKPKILRSRQRLVSIPIILMGAGIRALFKLQQFVYLCAGRHFQSQAQGAPGKIIICTRIKMFR
jgi:hypothetical protein